LLIREKAEKERDEVQKRYNRNAKTLKRLSLQQVEYIKQEFLKPSVERDFSLIDRLLHNLKFLKRFDQPTRATIYSQATHLSLPGHTVIFNQGDIGDKLYVILKGRVAVQIQGSREYGRMPVVVATLGDGEQFGELSLISMNRVQD
jgi:CRP-like cAMP-binding protein